jgi:hypothetical protein
MKVSDIITESGVSNLARNNRLATGIIDKVLATDRSGKPFAAAREEVKSRLGDQYDENEFKTLFTDKTAGHAKRLKSN